MISILHSLDEMILPFGIPKQDLANYLGDAGVIAGSFAMASLIPDFGSIGDMDIFKIIPAHHPFQAPKSMDAILYFESITTWFARYGYEEDGASYEDAKNIYDFSTYIYKVQTFKHLESGVKIDFVHIKMHYMYIAQNTDFTINNTYIAFQNANVAFPMYNEVYISRNYTHLMEKRLMLSSMDGVFRKDGVYCPLDSVTAPKRLTRLEKYLARGFVMEPELLAQYKQRLADFM